jgi:hypothetical protein
MRRSRWTTEVTKNAYAAVRAAASTELEAAGLVQSADYILDQAAAQGRNVERQRQAVEDSVTRERLRKQLARREE